MYLFKGNLTIMTKVINSPVGFPEGDTRSQLWHCQKRRALGSTCQALSER